MAEKSIKTRVQMKRGSQSDWITAEANGFLPLEGEFIFYTDLNKTKVGKKDAEGNLIPLSQLDFLNANDADTLDGKHAADFALASHGEHVTASTVKSALGATGASTSTKYLREDGTWETPPDTTYTAAVANGDSGLMTGSDKAKLDGVAPGAEVNVQSDWNQADNTKDDFIKNKPAALKNPNALSIGGKSYDGSSAVSITATELRTHLGIDNALHFVGLTTTTIADNSTTTTITVDGKSHTAVAGDVVLYSDNEYVFDGSKWLELGDGSSHALKTNTITAGNGLTGGGQVGSNPTLNVGQGNGITVEADTVSAKAGNGITVDATGINHADTSSQASVTADGRKYITGVTLDTYGHVTGLTTGTETVTDTNQKIKAGSVTFGADDTVEIVAGTNVAISGDATNKKITISATDTNTHNSHAVISGKKADGSTDIKGTASSGDITLGDSGVTAGEYGPTANQTPAYGATFNVPDIKVNAKGIVTSVVNRTVKIPASDNTDTGATSVEVVGSGNAVTTASYDAATRKVTLTKDMTFATKAEIDSLISHGTEDPSSETTSQYYFKYN